MKYLAVFLKRDLPITLSIIIFLLMGMARVDAAPPQNVRVNNGNQAGNGIWYTRGNNSNVDVTWNWDPVASGQSFQYNLDEYGWRNIRDSLTSVTLANLSVSDNQQHSLKIRHSYKDSNATDYIYFFIDQTTPVIRLTGTTGQTNTPVWHFEVNDAQIATCRYKFDTETEWTNITIDDSNSTMISQTLEPIGLGDGDHTLTVETIDVAGNADTKSYTITSSEQTIPIIDFTGTLTPTNLSNPTWQIKITDIDTIVKYRFNFNGGGWGDDIPVASASNSVIATYQPSGLVSDGIYTLGVEATDIAGNVGINSFAITFDRAVTAPVLMTTASALTNGASVHLSWEAILDSDLKRYEVVINGGIPIELDKSMRSYDYTMTADGNYTFAVNAIDDLENRAASNQINTVYDKTAPAIDFTGTDATTSNSRPTWYIAMTDINNITKYRLNFNQVGWNDYIQVDPFINTVATTYQPSDLDSAGTYILQIEATDGAGNVSAADFSINYTKAVTAPVLTTTAANTTNIPLVHLTWEGYSGNGLQCYRIVVNDGASVSIDKSTTVYDYTMTTDGPYSFVVNAVDDLGNNIPSNRITLVFDKTGPQLETIHVDPSGVTSNDLPMWSWSAPEDAVSYKIVLAKDGSMYSHYDTYTSTIYQSELPDGIYQLSVIAVDALGNESAPKSSSLVTIDTTGPDLSDIDVIPFGRTKDTQPKWSWRAPADTLHYKIALIKDGMLVTHDDTYTETTYQPELPDGSYQLIVIAVDVLGNESIPKSSPTVTIDTTGPDLGDIDVIPFGETTNTQPVWSWNAPEDAVSYKIVLIKDGSTYLSNDKYISATYQPTLTDGTYQLTVVAVDALGNESSARTSATVTIAATGLSLGDINVTPSGETTNTQPVWSWSAPEDAVSYKIVLDKNGSLYFRDDAYTSTTYQRSLEDGTYRLTVIAVDASKNESAPKSSIFMTIDTTGPDLGDIDVIPTGRTKNTQPEWSWNAPEDAVSYKMVLIKDGLTYLSNDKYTSATYQPTLEDGTYQLTVIAEDALGNESAPKSSPAIIIDTTGPGLGDIDVIPSGRTKNRQPTWSWRAPADAVHYKVVLRKDEMLVTHDDAYTGTSYQPTLTSGSYYLTVIAVDDLGNESATMRSAIVTIDTTGLDLGDIDVVPFGRTKNMQPEWSWRAPADAVRYKLALRKDEMLITHDDAYTGTSYQPTLTDGSYYLTVIAVDEWGNESATMRSATVTVDTTGPDLEDIEVNPSETTKNTKPEWSWSAPADADRYIITLIKDGSSYFHDGAYRYNTYQPSLPDGSYQLRVIAIDALGNESAAMSSVPVTIDATGPMITIINPIAKAEPYDINSAATIIVQFSDRSGIKNSSIKILIDGDTLGVSPTAIMGDTLYYVKRNNYDFKVVDHAVTVHIEDNLGNVAEKTVIFKVNNYRKGFGFGRLKF